MPDVSDQPPVGQCFGTGRETWRIKRAWYCGRSPLMQGVVCGASVRDDPCYSADQKLRKQNNLSTQRRAQQVDAFFFISGL